MNGSWQKCKVVCPDSLAFLTSRERCCLFSWLSVLTWLSNHPMPAFSEFHGNAIGVGVSEELLDYLVYKCC